MEGEPLPRSSRRLGYSITCLSRLSSLMSMSCRFWALWPLTLFLFCFCFCFCPCFCCVGSVALRVLMPAALGSLASYRFCPYVHADLLPVFELRLILLSMSSSLLLLLVSFGCHPVFGHTRHVTARHHCTHASRRLRFNFQERKPTTGSDWAYAPSKNNSLVWRQSDHVYRRQKGTF